MTEREKAIVELNNMKQFGLDYANLAESENAIDLAIEALKEQRETAHWNYRVQSNHFECSNCYMRFDQRYNYCPNCGADMRGEKNVE